MIRGARLRGVIMEIYYFFVKISTLEGRGDLMLKISWKEIDKTARRSRKFSGVTKVLANFEHFFSNLA